MSKEDEPNPREDQEILALLASASAVQASFDRLVGKYRDRLIKRVQKNIPADMAGVFDAEDVVQEASQKAFRDSLSFRDCGPGSFYRWFAVIADNALRTKVEALRAIKRGRGRVQVAAPEGGSPDWSSMAGLLELVAVDKHTPSSSAARREAAPVLQKALLELNARQCAALILCHLHAWSRERAADAMDLTPEALGSLLDRGLKTLRKALGERSDYLSGK